MQTTAIRTVANSLPQRSNSSNSLDFKEVYSLYRFTEIYCMANDYCKEFTLQQQKYMIEDKKSKHRDKPNRMSDAEIIVILILFHSGGFRCFKHYYCKS